MAFLSNLLTSTVLLAATAITVVANSCDPDSLNKTIGTYYISEEGTTIFDVAKSTNRGVCDIGRLNLMVDVAIPPNIGQTILIPAEVCEPDNETCLLPRLDATRKCIYGGPRLYWTVKGDTFERIALHRLNITVESLMADSTLNASATDVLDAGQYLKIPQCYPSQCVIQPFQFTRGVYKDLAEKYGSTVGQIMMLSPTYNYSQSALTGDNPPTIDLPINCTALSQNVTVLS